MHKHIDKIYAFLVVYESKSFSKASKILNISQPAVTQKIKQLEKFLGCKLIERKKNGVLLTNKGKYFLEIAQNMQECVDKVSTRIKYFKEKSLPLIIGATSSVANYILPNYLSHFKQLTNKDMNLIVNNNKKLVDLLLNNELDIAFLTTKIIHPDIELIPFKEDKIVFFSNKPLPETIEFNNLLNYKFLCRENGSSLKDAISNTLKQHSKDCKNLNITSYVNDTTALKFTILNYHNQYVSVMSYNAIKEEVEQNKLFITKVKNIDFKRTIYIAKQKTDNSDVDAIINYLINQK